MTAPAGVRQARHSCGIFVALGVCLTTGFHIVAPRGSNSRQERWGTLAPTCLVGQIHQPRQSVGVVLCEEGVRCLQRRGWVLLSGREDGDGHPQAVEPPAELRRAPVAAAAEAAKTEATAPPLTPAAPRRYVGDGAGVGDEVGVGGPKGDGRGKEWTVDLCCKRLSLLHRKLRQVKSLQAQQARDPDSLDGAQRVKLGRKQTLVAEISELESLRRDFLEKERESGADAGGRDSTKEKKSRVPPGPFAVVNAAGDGSQQRQQADLGERVGEDDGAEYTRDGLRLASPRRMVQPPAPAAAAAGAASALRPTENLRRTTPAPSSSLGEADFFADSVAGFGGSSSMEALKEPGSSIDEHDRQDDQQGGGGINFEARYEGGGGQAEDARPMVEAPAGGYPKRLALAMSFCRVSDRETCEILVEMGRVTVNGVVATDPGIKVDLLTDIVVANGSAVTFPGKIDNSDETRKPREDEGKRTGPIPKAEKNTWKQKTKYRWNMDDGLLAKRTRRAANAKAFDKKRRLGAGRNDEW